MALAGRSRLHGFLTARAGHSVTATYAERVQTRSEVAATIVVLLAFTLWLSPLQRWPLREGMPETGEKLARSNESGGSLALTPVAIILLAIGIVERALLLAKPIHYDEAFTVTEFASRSPLFFLARYTHANNHVFHSLLLWMIRLGAGNRLWALRLPAFCAGIGVLMVTYWLARRLGGETTALLALALAAVATPLVEYSAQARGYTIITLLFLLLYVVDDDRLRGVLMALGAWTIPTMIYAAAAWGFWAVITRREWHRLAMTAFIGGTLTFVFYLPILIVTGLDSIIANGNTLSVPYPVLARELPKTFVQMARDWNLAFSPVLAIVIAVAALVAVLRRRSAGTMLWTAALAILSMLIVTRKVPFPRIWIFVLPLYLIAAADSIAYLFGRLTACQTSPWVIRHSQPDGRKAGIANALCAALITAAGLLAWKGVSMTEREDFLEDPALRDIPSLAASIRTLPPDARVLVTSPLDAPMAFSVPDRRLVQDRFDSDPASVRAAMAAVPLRYLVASTRQGGMQMYRQLALPYVLTPARRFPHATLFELRSPP